MIPIRDLLPTHSKPIVTWIIVGTNVAAFLLAMSDLDAAARALGAVPAHFTGMDPAPVVVHTATGNLLIPPVPRDDLFSLRILTHMWTHGGLLHLCGNMWFLWVFGDNVEDRLGPWRYLLLYLASGLVALTGQVIAEPDSGLPMVGASGAVSGVLGAYLRFFPLAKVLTLFPIGFILMTFVWPARVFLGIWIALQVVQAALDRGGGGGVAWWAHIGGFALGFVLAPALAPADREHPPRELVAGRRRHHSTRPPDWLS